VLQEYVCEKSYTEGTPSSFAVEKPINELTLISYQATDKISLLYKID